MERPSKYNKRVRGAPKGGLRTQETRLATALIKFRNKERNAADMHCRTSKSVTEMVYYLEFNTSWLVTIIIY